MKSDPARFRVSVIVPTFNRAQLIAETLASAARQSAPPEEIIVVDDGSTDNTAEVVRSVASPVRYLRKDNKGKAAALNWGICEAKGDCILVLDDDDLLPPWAIASHLAAFGRSPAAGFSFGGFSRFSGPAGSAHLSDDVEPLPELGERRLLVQLMLCCFLPNPTWMVRRDVQQRAGPYQLTLPRGQDYDMILRLARISSGVHAEAITLYQRKHVAVRMTSAGTVVGKDTVAGWIAAEQSIFGDIDDTWPDDEFRPFDDVECGPHSERLAVLQRAVILFMRKLYDRAAAHLRRYVQLLASDEPTAPEIRVAADLLGARYGIDDIIDGACPPELLAGLNLPMAVRRSMASQMPWRLRELLENGRIADGARLAGWAGRAFGPSAVAQTVGQKLEAMIRRE